MALVVCLFLLLFSCNVSARGNGTKKERLMNLLSMVRFNNELCSGTDGRFGVCVPRTQCTEQNGTPNGECAQGFGVCCLMLAFCGGNLRVNNTYFASPGFPAAISGAVSCQVTVFRLHQNICQLRLDFETFALSTTTDGQCTADSLKISGQESSQEIPVICGVNNGQHMYIHLSQQATSPVILMLTSTRGNNKKWKIRVSQIECGDPAAAPSNCLQYFVGQTGTFRSFNFDAPIPEPGGGQANYMNGMNYAICIRREAGFCGVQFLPLENLNGAFDVDPGMGVDDQSSTDAFCTNDALIIPGAINAGENGMPIPNQISASRFCGLDLSAGPSTGRINTNGVVTMLPGLVQVFFITDDNPPAPNRYDRGFHLRFNQRPCNFRRSQLVPMMDPNYITDRSPVVLKSRPRLSKLIAPFTTQNPK